MSAFSLEKKNRCCSYHQLYDDTLSSNSYSIESTCLCVSLQNYWPIQYINRAGAVCMALAIGNTPPRRTGWYFSSPEFRPGLNEEMRKVPYETLFS